MEKEYSVSALICVKDKKYELRKALNSVLNQTRKVDEIVIVDSTQDVEVQKYIESIQEFDINYLKTSDDLIYSDFQLSEFGIRVAKSDYIAFLSARDIWHDNHIEKMMANVKADIVISGFLQKVGLQLVECNSRDEIATDILESTLLQYLFAPSSTLIKRDFALNLEQNSTKDFDVAILPEVLSTHWSNAHSTVEKIEQIFWEDYSEILDKLGISNNRGMLGGR